MRERLSNIFHIYAKELVGRGRIPLDHTLWPKEWLTILFKEYSRLERVKLPKPVATSQKLEDVIIRRFSEDNYERLQPPALEDISSLLHFSAGIRTNGRNLDRALRFYPSGGSRFPLEIYYGHKGSESLRAGIYHYHLPSHSLERLADNDQFEKIRESFTYPFAKKVPAFLIITSVWERTLDKYQDFGYPIILTESGHLSQNILLMATALNIKNRPYVGFRFGPVADALDLDTAEEAPLSMILLGK